MWFAAFIIFVLCVMVWDAVSDRHFTDRMKDLEED